MQKNKDDRKKWKQMLLKIITQPISFFFFCHFDSSTTLLTVSICILQLQWSEKDRQQVLKLPLAAVA